MAEKKYFWLKLKDDFFDEKYIKALRRLPQGDSLVIVYLKMQLKSLKTNGIIKYEKLLPDSVSELAMFLDEPENIVKLAVNALINFGAVERWENETLYMTAMQELIGSESESAERVRKYRALKKAVCGREETPKLELTAKTNAERQRAFRAKKVCEQVQHVPFVEDHTNLKRYGGNYYIVMKRDKYKCATCGSIENLCVHHIDGYDENKPENNRENKMLVLCRACHSKVHAGTPIPSSILEDIDYYDCNVTLPGNSNVTSCNTEIDIDKDIEIEKEIEKEQEKKLKKESVTADIEEFFERVWKLYPKKTNKTQIRKATKERLYKIGYEKIARCIERYKQELEYNHTEYQFIKAGSTFFNGGYEDYLADDWRLPPKRAMGQRHDYMPNRTPEEQAELESKLAKYKFD